jgi:hypothetical protein
MRSTKTLLLLIFGAMLLAGASQAFANNGNFTISGTVTDANWNPVPGANVTVYDNQFNVIRIQTTDANGQFFMEELNASTFTYKVHVEIIEGATTYQVEDYMSKWHQANGVQSIDTSETHFDNYYMVGSMPRVSPTPTPLPTVTPTPTPEPTAVPEDSLVPSILLVAGGFIGGAIVATLVCFFFMRARKKS